MIKIFSLYVVLPCTTFTMYINWNSCSTKWNEYICIESCNNGIHPLCEKGIPFMLDWRQVAILSTLVACHHCLLNKLKSICYFGRINSKWVPCGSKFRIFYMSWCTTNQSRKKNIRKFDRMIKATYTTNSNDKFVSRTWLFKGELST